MINPPASTTNTVSPATPEVYDFSICLCTFQRPHLLDSLLQHLSIHHYAGLQGELIVVDNDPNGSASAVLDDWRQRFPIPLTPLHVRTQNIALARNAALDAAKGRFIVILDDDEWPNADWFQALVAAQVQHNADAIFGPVMPHYASDVPEWIQSAGFFAARQFPEGAQLRGTQTYTSNVLIRRSALSDIDGPFDPSFGLTGGSDAMLFQTMAAQGARLIWTNTAFVNEIVPRSRANFPWLLRRAYSGGQLFARIEMNALEKSQRRLRAIQMGGQALFQLLASTVFCAAMAPASRAKTVYWLRKAAAQCGKITGLAGLRYRAYDLKTKHRAN